MTDQDLTAPEAVERLAKSLAFVANRTGLTVEKCEQITDDSAATLRALSYAHATALVQEQVANAKAMQHLRRAEAAEAKLNEAVGVLERVEAFEFCAAPASEEGIRVRKFVRAFLAAYRTSRATQENRDEPQ